MKRSIDDIENDNDKNDDDILDIDAKKIKSTESDDYDENSDDENDDGDELSNTNKSKSQLRKKCPYLDTINRQMLDFDQLKGRSKSSPAYTHSVQHGHFVFMNLHDSRTFCLPDGYAVIDQSLDDVKKCLAPVFNDQQIVALNKNSSLARDIHGVSYLPGFIGLNNLKHTDYANVILHVLSHVSPLRDFFLNCNNYSSSKSVICNEFGQIIRKLWSNENFKSVISPVEFIQGISTLSKKRFDIGKSSECVDFLIWLLGELHRGLGGSNKKKTVIYDSFQGEIEIKTRTFNSKSSYLKADKNDMSISEENDESFVETITTTNFNFLSLDIPPTPLFRDSSGGMIIPQIPLFEVLKKFDGRTWTDHVDASGKLTRKQFSIKKLPKYLILHLVRFTKNNFNAEKNVTIVTFPVKNLELKDYLYQNNETLLNIENIEEKSIIELKEIVRKYGSLFNVSKLPSIIDRHELVNLATNVISDANSQQLLSSKYDLLSNICHDSVVAGAGSGSKSGGKATKNVSQGGSGGTNSNTGARSSSTEGYYRTHLQNKATGQWFELQDLHVSETMPQLIGLSESYMLIYERKDIK